MNHGYTIGDIEGPIGTIKAGGSIKTAARGASFNLANTQNRNSYTEGVKSRPEGNGIGFIGPSGS